MKYICVTLKGPGEDHSSQFKYQIHLNIYFHCLPSSFWLLMGMNIDNWDDSQQLVCQMIFYKSTKFLGWTVTFLHHLLKMWIIPDYIHTWDSGNQIMLFSECQMWLLRIFIFCHMNTVLLILLSAACTFSSSSVTCVKGRGCMAGEDTSRVWFQNAGHHTWESSCWLWFSVKQRRHNKGWS